MVSPTLAIVSGEWQFDSDQTIRLYVRPTLTLIDHAGAVHHVSAFGYPSRRTVRSHDPTSCIVLPGSTGVCITPGGSRAERVARNKKWLESSTRQTVHNLGDLSYLGAPVMGFLITRSVVCINELDKSADLICVEDTYNVSPYDEPIRDVMLKMRIGNV